MSRSKLTKKIYPALESSSFTISRISSRRRIELLLGPPSRYLLRREPNLAAVSTFEAIARALGVLEGAATQARLEGIFQIMVDRTLHSRGQKPQAMQGAQSTTKQILSSG